MRKNLISSQISESLSSGNQLMGGSGVGKGDLGVKSLPGYGNGSVNEFDDCESDAEFEDDEDNEIQSRDEGQEEKIFTNIESAKTSDENLLAQSISALSKLFDSTLDFSEDNPMLNKNVNEFNNETNKLNNNDKKNIDNKEIQTKLLDKSPIIGAIKKKLKVNTDHNHKEKSCFVPLESSKLSEINCRNVALSVGELGHGRVVSCGYWDNSLKVHALDSLREVASVNSGHLGDIVCVQLGYQGSHTLITGVSTHIPNYLQDPLLLQVE